MTDQEHETQRNLVALSLLVCPRAAGTEARATKPRPTTTMTRTTDRDSPPAGRLARQVAAKEVDP